MSKYPNKKIAAGRQDLWEMAMGCEDPDEKTHIQKLFDGLNEEMAKLSNKRKPPKRRESVLLTPAMQKELKEILDEGKRKPNKITAQAKKRASQTQDQSEAGQTKQNYEKTVPSEATAMIQKTK